MMVWLLKFWGIARSHKNTRGSRSLVGSLVSWRRSDSPILLMRIFRDMNDRAISSPTVLTFGVFDGLHLAHQLIMRRVVERARELNVSATVVTFDPHPRAVLHPETAPPLLQTFDQKMEGNRASGGRSNRGAWFYTGALKTKRDEFLLTFHFRTPRRARGLPGPGVRLWS